jgi:hypothetical protein
MFEMLLRDIPNLRPGDRALVDTQIEQLRSRVGTVDVRVLEPGASIVIDGRHRGMTPSGVPFRVSAGSHLIRVVKEGFSPLELRVEVAGGQYVPADGRLAPLTRFGRLKVVEASGSSADVLVDNVRVGKTPWEGTVDVGVHMVLLRGESDLGSQPASSTVRTGEVATLSLTLVPLACKLRVVPTPAGAAVAIDAVALGHGGWEGRVRCGTHRVEVAAEGFLESDRTVMLTSYRPETVDVGLERDPSSRLWRRANPPRIAFDATLVPAFSPGFGGDVDASCKASCSARPPFGALAFLAGGYQLSSGIGVGVQVGYLWLRSSMSHRPAGAHQVPSGAPLDGNADDALTLRGLAFGAAPWVRRGASWPVMLRLGLGALIGSMSDERTATLAPPGGRAVRWDVPEQRFDARYLYVAPEARIGYRIAKHAEVNLGLQVGVFFAVAKPTWEPTADLYKQELAYVDFDKQPLSADVLVVFAPGAGFAMDFY